jgi:protein SCO1/2
MNTMSKSIAILLAASVLSTGGCGKPAGKIVERPPSRLPVYNSRRMQPAWLHEDPVPEKDIHHVLDFSLTDQQGQARTLADLDGKIYVSYFFFASCAGICLKMAEELKRVQNSFSEHDEVRLVGHSVTPGVDTVTALAAYGKQKGINPERWHLLTGEKKEIFDLARKSYFAVTDGKDDDYKNLIHTENLVLVDKEKMIRGVYNGTYPQDVNRLVEDIAVLLEEQAGAAADR